MSELFELDRQRGDMYGRTVNFIANGVPTKTFTLQLKMPISRADVAKAVELKWGSKYSRLRLFNIQGVEYYEEDLKYLKQNENIYVSKGEEYDANSSFGEYDIVKSLGEGGFGKVSLGKHKGTGELVAIKVMKASKIRNAHDIDVVFREVQNLKALNHPNIVKIYNCYALKDMQVVVMMEYIEGGQLLQYLRSKGKLESSQALLFLAKIVSAIEYCHSKNIVHRDLKLENILIKKVETQDIKVADFGISGVAEQFNPDVDSGTLKYMAPEVLNGSQRGNSPAVDLWALGCILYYLLYGKLPFIGKNNNETIKIIIQGVYKLPKQTIVSEQVTNLMSRMLDPNPKTRIKITELRDQLEKMNETRKQFCVTQQSEIGLSSSNGVSSIYSRYSNQQSRLPQLNNSKALNYSLVSNEGGQQKRPGVAPTVLNFRPPLYSKKTSVYPSANSIPRSGGTGLSMVVPKRLQKEKFIIESELKDYQLRKKAPFQNTGMGSGDRTVFRSYDKRGGVRSQQAVVLQKDKINASNL